MRRIKVHPKHASEARLVQDGKKVRLLTLSDLDLRTTAARRAHELIDSVHADLGGVDHLATGEQQLVQRACMIATMAEDIEAKWLLGESIDAAMLCTLSNAQRRLFETIGFRRARDVSPDLQTYLRSKEVAE